MAEENEIQPYVIGLDMGGTNSVFGVVEGLPRCPRLCKCCR